MGHSQAEKAENRERILAEAARQIREKGLDAISVGPLMQSVGLTHGGFYNHFLSRADLIAQALERALSEGEATAKAAHRGDKPRAFPDVVRSYLSRKHRDSRQAGCAVSALVSDVGRSDEEARSIMSAHVEAIVRQLADMLDGDETQATAAFSTMVGALALSRVMIDPAASERVLRAARDHLLGAA